MTKLNKVGLFGCFLILVGLIEKAPIKNTLDFICFSLLFVFSCIALLWTENK